MNVLKMNRYQLFRLLRRNDKLREKRNPAFDQNRIAKVIAYIGAGLMGAYLLFISIGFGYAANKEGEPAFMMFILPFIMTLDFLLRFVVQQTPAMLVKPYMLLPLPRQSVIETFLVRTILNGYNWLWLCLFVPYAILIAFGIGSVGEALLLVAVGMVLMLVNSQWYLLVRTLIHQTMLWWILPLAVYAAYYVPVFLSNMKVAETVGYCLYTVWALWAALVLLVVMFFVNRIIQFRFVYIELSREEKKSRALKNVSQFTFLERFGQTGEYLKLELKSIMRNKAIRSRVLMSIVIIVIFTLLLAYTNVYDGRVMQGFWCYYCFALYGMSALVKVMSPEGNYIDLLMTQRENILMLLKAKYVFHVVILIIPCVLMLPAVIAGKFSPMMMIGFLLFSAGVLYFLLFQLAVINKQTLPLNEKITGKGNIENGIQLLLQMASMFGPILLVTILLLVFDNDLIVYGVLAIIGLVFVVLSPWWLRNIYKRMMRRKYINLEGFHATR